MGNLTLLEQATLEILKQLEYRCDIATPIHLRNRVLKNNTLNINVDDIDLSSLKMSEDIIAVENYLWTKGLEFHMPLTEIDYINLESQLDLEAGRTTIREIPPATIKGESIEAIKTKIRELIDELDSKNTAQKKKKINIAYHDLIGQFVFNGENTVEVNGKQKDISDYLVMAGKNKKISWDEIYEKMLDTTKAIDGLNRLEINLAKKSINGVVTEINKKTERYLEQGISLINLKENEYWLQYEVGKDG